MPDFFLETGSAERHAEFDALPDIARGYIEAAFFTGLTYVFPDPGGDTLLCKGTRGDCLEIDGLGLGNLDAESFRDMATDAARFWIENAQMLETATGSGAYDLEQAGRDFWFSRNGHGVGFFDRGLGDAGDALESAAQYREIDLFAEQVAGIDPDPDAPDGWTVSLGSRVDPLTDAERAALDALDGEPVAEPLRTVGGRYGAPMGRRAHVLDPGAGAVTVRRVTLDPGGYDSGGAYWGLGLPLWRAIDGDGSPDYLRAASRGAALEAIRAQYSGVAVA